MYLSSEESKYNASGLLVGVSHATAAVLAPGSTTTHTEVTVAATLGHNMPRVTKFSPAASPGPNHGTSAKRSLGHGDAKDCPLHTHNGTKALTRHSKLMGRGPGRPIKARGSPHEQGGCRRVLLIVAGEHHISWAATWTCSGKHVGRVMGWGERSM